MLPIVLVLARRAFAATDYIPACVQTCTGHARYFGDLTPVLEVPGACIAGALSNEAQPDYTLLYARIAQALRPDHTDALLLTAELLALCGDPGIEILREALKELGGR